MIIQALNDDHASAFQTLRLLGLRESPASFGSSYEEGHFHTESARADSVLVIASQPEKQTSNAGSSFDVGGLYEFLN
jgi:hypothetical protein